MKPPSGLSRREFLKLSTAGLLAGLLAELGLDTVRAFDLPVNKQGRMVYSGVALYQAPDFEAKKVRLAGRDEVLDIVAEVTGGYPTDYNRLWYRFADGTYTYSGWIQPVETRRNQPADQVPEGGQLAEVTVPFAETRREPGTLYRRGLRLYYGTTYWVHEVFFNDTENTTWYRVYDKETESSVYAAAEDLRLIPDEELSLLSPAVPPDLKFIQVDVSTQSLVAFEDDEPVLMARISSGTKGSKTPLGIFRTYHKGPSIHMVNQDDSADYDLPGVPWVSFFTGTGVSFHGTYWHNDYGIQRSHGCVNLNMAAAKFIYRWTLPVVLPGEDYIHEPGQGTFVQVISSLS